MTTRTDEDLIRWWFKGIDANGGSLSEKQIDLVESFRDQFEKRSSLSPRQMEILESIYDQTA